VSERVTNMSLSIIILTFNEEKNIEACLKSVCHFADEIFIVDSYSTDKTLEIVQHYTNNIHQHPFETHSKQWKWALENLTLKTEWILGLDADQIVTSELADEIHTLLKSGNHSLCNGYYIKKRQYFLGKWIKHGGYYPKYLLKLFRREKVNVDENEAMDHHFYVTGKTGKLRNDFIEDNKNETIDFWSKKHIHYASLQIEEELFNQSESIINSSFFGNNDQRRLAIKKIWIKSPLFLRTFLYFFYRYFILFGILDGREGLIFHFLQAFWYRFLVDAKIFELKKLKA